MLNDIELTEISHDIDDILLALAEKHDILPIHLSGIVMARLIRMNELMNTQDHFYQLAATVANKQHLETEKRILQ